MADKFGMACELLKDIDVGEEEKEEKKEKEGKITKSFLRKVYELLNEAEGKEDYIISVGYMVARRAAEAKKEKEKKEKREIKVEDIDVVKFFKRLERFLSEKLQGDWNKIRGELRGILEQTIKIYYIKAELGEEVCKRL